MREAIIVSLFHVKTFSLPGCYLNMKHLVYILFLLLSTLIFGQNVQFKLKGIENYTGVIRIAVYDSESGYDKESTDLRFTFKKKNLKSGTMNLEMDLQPGKYAVAFLDDTNLDAEMNYNLIGIPKEGYAYSKVIDYGFSKPSFKEALIEVKDNGNNKFEIKFNYF